MKKILIALLLLMPLTMAAQSEWEVPKTAQQRLEEARKAEAAAKKALKEAEKEAKKAGIAVEKEKEKKEEPKELKDDPKYLADAVPEVDGKVTFTLDLDVPGKDARQIYDIVYGYLDTLTVSSNQLEGSRIALVNKTEHVIAATMKEWLIFNSSFLSLDRSQFNYALIVNCTDGHLNMTLSRISYAYETDRPTGFTVTAEKWITDKYALNKSKTALTKGTAKFRRKTIDRKDEIFGCVTQLLKNQ